MASQIYDRLCPLVEFTGKCHMPGCRYRHPSTSRSAASLPSIAPASSSSTTPAPSSSTAPASPSSQLSNILRSKEPSKQAREPKPLCKKWVQGECWGRCGGRHFYDETDERISHHHPRDTEPGALFEFSSPYQGFRIIKEVKKLRRVEVDLETGRKRSFIEEKEFEVLDLTKARSPAPLTLRRENTNTMVQVQGSQDSFAKPPVVLTHPSATDNAGGGEPSLEDSVIILDSPESSTRGSSSTRPRGRKSSLRL